MPVPVNVTWRIDNLPKGLLRFRRPIKQNVIAIKRMPVDPLPGDETALRGAPILYEQDCTTAAPKRSIRMSPNGVPATRFSVIATDKFRSGSAQAPDPPNPK